MTIRRADEAVLLEGVCTVEEAEVLMNELQAGATVIDWSGCLHLHTACLQVILAADMPMRGTPANPAIARWLTPLVDSHTDTAGPVRSVALASWQPEAVDPETACLTEA